MICIFDCRDRLKQNLDAAEERGSELQRLLDASRLSESQTLIALRSLKQRRIESGTPAEPDPPVIKVGAADSSNTPADNTICRLMEDLAEMEERLVTVESDLMDEKRKRMNLEEELDRLTLENQRLEGSVVDVSSHSAASTLPPAMSLSLSEELLISSGDYNSAQWNEAWDNSGPLSLIGSVHIKKSDEELSSGSSGESGFSDEQHHRQNCIHKTTQTEDLTARRLQRSSLADDAVTSNQDSKTLFREIFAVIKQNL